MYMREDLSSTTCWLSVALYKFYEMCGEVIRLRQGLNMFEFSDILLELSSAYETKNEGKETHEREMHFLVIYVDVCKCMVSVSSSANDAQKSKFQWQ